MKNILLEQEDALLQLFNTIMELATNHGQLAILQALYELLELDGEQI